MSFVLKALKGSIIGVGVLLPGVSGSILAMVFNMYDLITQTLANPIKMIKKNFFELLPIGIGGVIGVFVCSFILNAWLENNFELLKCAFIGMMIGSLPVVYGAAKAFKPQKRNYVFGVIAVAMMIALALFNNITSSDIQGSTNPLSLIFYGLVVGFGTIVPGMSASALLIYFGGYQILLGAIANLEVVTALFIGIGLLISLWLTSKLIQLCLKKFAAQTSYAILGFAVGSIFLIMPDFSQSWNYLLGLALAVVGFVIALCFAKAEEKMAK